MSLMTPSERKAAILEALAGLRDDEALDALDSTKNLILSYSIAGKLAASPAIGAALDRAVEVLNGHGRDAGAGAPVQMLSHVPTVDAIRKALAEGSPS